MSDRDIARMVHHAVVRIRPLEGDPGHLRKVANDMRSFTMDYECPSDFDTTSYNDLHINDLHRMKILPYIRKSDANDILNRKRMVYNNPATVSFYFFMRSLIRRRILADYSYPTHFTKWFINKYEFQNRGSVHEHALKKLIYLFLNKENAHKTTFTPEDFVEVDIHGPKLAYYSSMRKIARMLEKKWGEGAVLCREGVEGGRGAVFNASTMEWSHGLETSKVVAQMTKNVIERFAR